MRTSPGKALRVAVCAALACGCASTATKQARSVKPSQFLGSDAELLAPGEKGQALKVYVSPGADWKAYQNILIEPVEYWTDPGKKRKLSPEDSKKLTDYFYSQLQQDFSKYWTVVREPGPGTIRYRAAIIDASGSNPTLDTVSNIVPQMMIVSGLRNAITGKPSAVGDVHIEVKATDAQTGALLAEAVDRRVGTKTFKGKFGKWDDAEAAFRYWASQSAFRLCTAQGRPDCRKGTEAGEPAQRP